MGKATEAERNQAISDLVKDFGTSAGYKNEEEALAKLGWARDKTSAPGIVRFTKSGTTLEFPVQTSNKVLAFSPEERKKLEDAIRFERDYKYPSK